MVTPANPDNSTDVVFVVAQVVITLLLLGSLVYLFIVQAEPSAIHLSFASLVVGYFFGGRAPASGVKQVASALRQFSAAVGP